MSIRMNIDFSQYCNLDSININNMSNIIIEDCIIKSSQKPLEAVGNNIGQKIFETLSENLDMVTQIETITEKQTTRREMKDRSIRCALWLRKQKLVIDDIVVVCTHNHLDAYVPVFAAFYAEVIFNPWNHDITLFSARQLMALFKPRIIFSCKNALDILMKAAELENLELKFVVFEKHAHMPSLNDIMQQQTEEEVERFIPQNLMRSQEIAAILLSSGSTGIQKGVMFSSEVLLKNSCPDEISTNCRAFLFYSTFSWISGVVLTIRSLLNRSIRIINQSTEFSVDEMCKVVEKYKVDYVFLDTNSFSQLAQSCDIEKYDLKSLKILLTAGSKVSERILTNLRKKIPHSLILHGYGLTEAGGRILTPNVEHSNCESLGFPKANVQLKVIDLESGKTLGPNTAGELCVKTPTMMLGYYKNPEATMQMIDKQGWLHTGDLVSYSKGGEIFFIDRLKELMKFRNHQVSPIEIEGVLMTHPAVLQVAVVPVPHELDGERPMAFVRIDPQRNVTAEELVELSAILGEHKKLWGGVRFLNELPMTASGKIARAQLRQLANDTL